MGKADYLKLGDWNAICDRCGAKFKGSALRKTWQGYMVCEKDWEPRQPQDSVRGIADPLAIPWARPKGTPDITLSCSPNGLTALPDVAVASCAIADYISPSYDPSIT
jgi:hypothetical protein